MDTIVELDHDFNIMMMNPAGEHVFGCKRDECLGKSFNQFLTSKAFLLFCLILPVIPVVRSTG